jgi:hypothetical protein
MTEAVPAGLPPGHPAATGPAALAPSRRPLGAEFAVGGIVLLVVALLGLPLGWLWQLVAPHTPAVREPDGAYLTDAEGEHRIADEGWYLLLSVGLGVLLVIVAWTVLRRYRGPIMLLALTLGAVACGIITWKFGHHFGLAHARALINAPTWTGTTNFVLPVDLRAAKIGLWQGWLPFAKGDVLAMPITVLLAYLLCVGFSPYPSLRATYQFGQPEFTAPVPGAYPGWAGPGEWSPAPGGRPAPPYQDLMPDPAQPHRPD